MKTKNQIRERYRAIALLSANAFLQGKIVLGTELAIQAQELFNLI